LGTIENPQTVKLNATLDEPTTTNIKSLLQEYYKKITWNYINLRVIPPIIILHCIELDTTIPHVHQVKYQMNLNFVAIVKWDLDKLLSVGFIALVEEANWLSPIIIILKKKWQTQDLQGFFMIQCYYQGGSIFFTQY
jgi:hypothetical protein